MVNLLIIMIVLLVVATLLMLTQGTSWGDIWAIVVVDILGGIVLFIVFAGSMQIGLGTVDNSFAFDVPIYSLERESEIHGEFCLGSGTIDQKQMYFYFEGDESTSTYWLGKTEAGYLPVTETNESKPHLEVWKETKGNGYVRFLLGTNFSCLSEEEWVEEAKEWRLYSKTYVKKIVVPKGTIIKQYKAN